MNIKRHIIWIQAIFVVLVCFSCVEPFMPDIGNEGYQQLLVVEGLITDQPGPFRVKLSYTIPLDTIRSAESVQGARVIIYDDNGGEYILLGKGNGWYESASNNLRAIPGVAYTLSIETPDGKQYESTSVALEPGPEIKNVHFEEFEKTDFSMIKPTLQTWLKILVDAKGEDGKKSYLKWEYEETWQIDIPYYVKIVDLAGDIELNYITPEIPFKPCWAMEKSSAIILGTSEALNENEIINVPLTSIEPYDTRLHVKYSILVKQYSLNKEFYDYWSKLEEVNENSGSMFDKTPISVYGNIDCCDDNSHALGYFMVSSLKEERIFIRSDQHPLYTKSGYEGCYYTEQPNNANDFYAGVVMASTRRLFQSTRNCVICTNRGTNVKPIYWE